MLALYHVHPAYIQWLVCRSLRRGTDIRSWYRMTGRHTEADTSLPQEKASNDLDAEALRDVKANLVAWLEENAIYLHPDIKISAETPIGDSESGSLAVRTIAETTLAQGTILGVIPKTAVLSARTSALSRWLPDYPQYFYAPEATCGLLLSACLLYETLLGSQSRWHGYIASLPRCRNHGDRKELGISLPLEWHRDSLDWDIIRHCEAGRIVQRADRRKDLPMTKVDGVASHHLIAYFHEQVLPLLSTVASHDAAVTSLSRPADLLSMFCGCYSLVSSRAFLCDIYHGLALCPLADAFNHADYGDNQVQFECNDEPLSSSSDNDTIDMAMTRTLVAEKHDQIFNSYGSLSNGQLLTSYGFALEQETNQERFTWDWRDSVERDEMIDALFPDISRKDTDIQVEQWAKLVSLVVVKDSSIAKEITRPTFEMPHSNPPPNEDLAQPAPKLLPLPRVSPFAHLARLDVIHNEATFRPLGSFLAWQEVPDSDDESDGGNAGTTIDASNNDSHLPFYINDQSQVSVSLWRAAVLAGLVRHYPTGKTSPQELISILTSVEALLAFTWEIVSQEDDGADPTGARQNCPSERMHREILLNALLTLQKLLNTRQKLLSNNEVVIEDQQTSLAVESALRHFYQESAILDIAVHNLQLIIAQLDGKI
ncbi:unnamed protein product [Sympodiomycopsis kandeliae]